jgi:PAS domain S-box-containing protein
MQVTVHCEKCGKALRASREMLGKRARCSGCGVEFLLSDPDDSSDSNLDSPPLADRPASQGDLLSRSMLPPTATPAVQALSADLICRLDPLTLRCIKTSDAAQRFFGQTDEQMKSRPFIEYAAPDDRLTLEHELRQAGHFGERPAFVTRFHAAGERLRHIQVHAQARYATGGRLHHIRCYLQDVTDRIRSEQRPIVQHIVAHVLAEASRLREAAPKVLETICHNLGWDLGLLWIVDQEGHSLRCAGLWHPPTLSSPQLDRAFRDATIAPGAGLAGRVWETGRPAWIADVGEARETNREQLVAQMGLRGGIACPVLFKHQVGGVLEFFGAEITKPDAGLLVALTAIGNQIGQLIERRRAEEEVRNLSAFLDSIVEHLPIMLFVKDAAQLKFERINKYGEQLLGYKRDVLLGKNDYDFFPKEEADHFVAKDREVLAGKKLLDIPEEVIETGSGPRILHTRKIPLLDERGEPQHLLGISEDITERKKAEDALNQERYLLHALMDNVPDAIYFKDAEGRFIRINRALAEKNKLADPADALGKTDFAFFTPDHAGPAMRDEQQVMQSGQPILDKEERETWPDGHVTWVTTNKLPLRDPQGRIVGTFGISRDITPHKLAEQALRDSEALYHSLVEGLPTHVLRKDLEGRFTFGNGLYLKTLGMTLDQLVGKTDHDLYPKELADKYRRDDQQVIEARQTLEAVEEHQQPGGERMFVQILKSPVFDAEARLIGVQVIFWDVTERHRMQARVQQSERLASLGLLSAGIAHEINNPVAYVANNLAVLDRDLRGLRDVLAAYEEGVADLARVRPDIATRITQLAEEIDLPYVKANLERILDSSREGVKRVADIVHKLRGFARVGREAEERVDIHTCVASSLEMVRGRLERRNITVVQNLGELPAIACAPAQMNQVFLNLMVNAMQAIEAAHKPTGKIEITTRAIDGEVIIEIADDGCGISADVLPQIFDPFTTTKDVGEGMGLGLSITHGIVTDHHGRIEVDSKVGEGARFRVILPVG